MTGPDRICTDMGSGRQRVRLLRQALVEVAGIQREATIGTLTTVTAAEARRLIQLGLAEAVPTIVTKGADSIRHLLLPAEIVVTKGAARRISVVASTSDLDRVGDTIDQNGWQLANYRKAPVVLANHDPAQPIARCASIGVEQGRLVAEVAFPEPGLVARSDEIWNLVTAGVLRGVSVGFRPLASEPTRTGWRYRSAELLELSLVSIAANPSCLIESSPLPRPAGKSEAAGGATPAVRRQPTEPARAAEVRRMKREHVPERAARLATTAAKAGRPRLARAARELAELKR